MVFFRKIVSLFLPNSVIKTFQNYKILSVEFGQYKSMQELGCIDRHGEPIPWYSYPAIEYIKQLDFSRKTVFEYGSGNSTLFWANRCLKLVSVEDNKGWFDKILPMLPSNVTYNFIADKESYVELINTYAEFFDVIIIDGSHRYDCVGPALQKLNKGGIIILDNSDWNAKTSKLLRDADLIEVDMSGFGPINGYTWTTSFYLKRDVQLFSADDLQPNHGIGAVLHFEI